MRDKQISESRPLSPHLQIYKPQITSVLSISHRVSGVFLSLGLLFVSIFMFFLAFGKDSYSIWVFFSNSLLGELILFGWVFALLFHMFNGIRHLFWDYGLGLSLPVARLTGIAVCFASVLISILYGIILLGLIL
jgi:succinate dehydrogenase / fumarate reductase, cytochrome b subunit